MPLSLYLSNFQNTQNLNRPDDNDAMDPTAPYALADTFAQGVEAVIRATSTDLGGKTKVSKPGQGQAGFPWITLLDLLPGPVAISHISATQFSITGDQSYYFNVGRRVRAFLSTGTILGTVTAVTVGANTTVTVSWDSGSLDGSETDVQASSLDPSNSAIPGGSSQTNNGLFAVVTDGGSGSAYTNQPPTGTPIIPPLTAYPIGPVFTFLFHEAILVPNPTVNLLGVGNVLLGAVPLVKNGSTPVAPGDIAAGQIGQFIYDGTNFQLVGNIITSPTLSFTVTNSGSGGTYTGNPSPAQTSYQTRVIYLFTFGTSANTATPVTVNLNSLGAITLKKDGTVDLEIGDIANGQILACVFDGTNFQVLGGLQFVLPAAGGGTTDLQTTPATITGGQSINTGALAALTTSPGALTLTAPKGGGPFRLWVSWFCAIDATLPGAHVLCDFQITDGSRVWAKASVDTPNGDFNGADASGLSPGPAYADGASVTLTLVAMVGKSDGSGAPNHAVKAGGASQIGGVVSTISAVFVPCN